MFADVPLSPDNAACFISLMRQRLRFNMFADTARVTNVRIIIIANGLRSIECVGLRPTLIIGCSTRGSYIEY